MLRKYRRGMAASVLSACALMAGGSAYAATFDITVTNESGMGGLYLTPFLLVAHDGSFDPFDEGGMASPALTALAEEGMVGGLQGEAGGFANGVAANAAGFGGAPVLDPGESATVRLTVDPTSDRYLSFFSMVIPSNDTFLGNDNPFAYEIFSPGGELQSQVISILGGDAWDAGTEVNEADGTAAAFSGVGGARTAENGTIERVADLNFLLGLPTVAGPSIDNVPSNRGLIASIEIAPVPLPASLPLLAVALGGAGLIARRKQRQKG